MEMKDILGIGPFGESLKLATEKSLSAAGAILGPLCIPVAAECGLMMRDEVRCWRAKNLERIAGKSVKFLTVGKDGAELHAHPKIIKEIVEKGSWAEDDVVQEMWAGLVGSSCTADGRDEGNMMFIEILSQMTSSQARLLNHICHQPRKFNTESGDILFGSLRGNLTSEQSRAVMGINDDYQIYLEMRQMHRMELIRLGGHKPLHNYSMAMRLFGLDLFVRCHGSRLSPEEFFPTLETKS
jgi:hypothetical protein